MDKLIKSISKGVGLVILIWITNTFIAFVPFSVESNTKHILITWGVVDLLLISSLVYYRKLDRVAGISAVVFVLLIVGSYFLPLNDNIPLSAIQINQQLSVQEEDKYDYARNLFFEVEKKYTSPVRQYLLEPWKVFVIKDFAYFWTLEDGGYADSSVQGRVYRKLLLNSGRFTEDEVFLHQSFCSNSPHLIVGIIQPGRDVIWADLWAVDNFPGSDGRDETYQFGQRTVRPCNKLSGEPY